MRALLVIAALLCALPAAAEERRFGGCSKSGNVCAGPTVSVSLVGYDLKAKKLQTGLMPGLGYSVSFATTTWHPVGFGVYAAIRQESGTTAGMFTVLASFAEYLRFGIARDVVSSTDSTPSVGRWIVLGGFGADFK